MLYSVSGFRVLLLNLHGQVPGFRLWTSLHASITTTMCSPVYTSSAFLSRKVNAECSKKVRAFFSFQGTLWIMPFH